MTTGKRPGAEERKPAILDALYAVIKQEGFENASIAKVAKKAGVHPSLIIHYFGTKERMVTALVDDVLRIYARLLETLPRTGSPEERLDHLLTLIWSRQWCRAASFSVLFSFLAVSRRNPEVAARVRRLFRRYREFLIVQLSAFSEAGVITAADPAGTADILISMSEGFHYFEQYHTPEEAFEEHRQGMIDAARKVLGAAPTEKRNGDSTEK